MIICGDALAELRKLPDESVNMCVTSPPYWGLRDYGVTGQLGLEKTPEEYVARMVEVFREVKRVLRDDGTLWLNLGDSYFSTQNSNRNGCDGRLGGKTRGGGEYKTQVRESSTLKEKDLCGIPWRVAFALQADGWYLRLDIIWSKPNPMPESVRDRPTRSHEYIFLMSKNARYYYDAEAIKEPGSMASVARLNQESFADQKGGPKDPHSGNRSCRKALENLKRKTDKQRGHGRRNDGFNDRWDAMEKAEQCSFMRNKRSVWTIATRPYPGAHFATFPPDLIEPCIKAGCPKGGTVLDPFFGAGTTGLVAMRLGRDFIGTELNQKYCEMAKKRIYSELMEAANV